MIKITSELKADVAQVFMNRRCEQDVETSIFFIENTQAMTKISHCVSNARKFTCAGGGEAECQ